jgi:hypothetical protein
MFGKAGRFAGASLETITRECAAADGIALGTGAADG